MTADRLSGLALFAFALAVALETRALPFGSARDPGPGFLPMLLAAVLGGLGLVIAAARGSPSLRALRWEEAPRALAILAALASIPFVLERLGFRLTMTLLVAFLLGVLERRQPAAAVAAALLLSLGSFAFFAGLLKVPLPRGPFGF